LREEGWQEIALLNASVMPCPISEGTLIFYICLGTLGIHSGLDYESCQALHKFMIDISQGIAPCYLG